MSREQLLAGGVGSEAVKHRLRRKRLHPVHRGVYSAMHPELLSRLGQWMAAVLAGGPGAVLSHLSAAALWGIAPAGAGPVHVTVPGRRRPRPGIRFHESRLPRDEISEVEGIPVTSVPRTIFDLAAVDTARRVERAINEAEVLRLGDRLTLDDLLVRYPGRQGNRNVRAALAGRRAGATLTKSELEERFLELLDAEGLPRPEINVTLVLPELCPEVDCLWRKARLVAELDSRTFHQTVAAFETDRERDRALNAVGWRTIRVTSRHLDQGRRALAADLHRLLGAPPALPFAA